MVEVYSKENCMPCKLVKSELERKGIEWIEKSIDDNQKNIDKLIELGYQSVPVVLKDSEVLFTGFRPDIIAEAL